MNDNNNPARDLQRYVCDYLNDELSSTGVTMLVEDNKNIEFEIQNALKKQGLAAVCMTPTMTYLGKTANGQAWQCSDLTLQFVEYVPVNRAKNKESFTSGFDAAFKCQRMLAGPDAKCGFGKFCPVNIEQGEDNGLMVVKATFDTYFVDEYVAQINPTEGEQFTVWMPEAKIEAPYDESTKSWVWTSDDKSSRLYLFYDSDSRLWKCYYFSSTSDNPEIGTSSQPADAKRITFENGWTALWSKAKTRGGIMTSDFKADDGNPVVATWESDHWIGHTNVYAIRIEQVHGLWRIIISDTAGGSWSMLSSENLTSKTVTFEGDNPLAYKQTWTWSEG